MDQLVSKSSLHRPAMMHRHGKPLRIAILSYRSDPKVGGQGVYVDYLSKALAEAGHKVDMLSGPPYPELDPKVGLVKIPSLDLYAQPHNGHLSLRPRHLLSPTDTYEYFGHLSGKFVEPYTFGQRVFQYLRQHADQYDVVLDNQTLAVGTLKIQTKLGLPMVTMIHHPITKDLDLALAAAPDWKTRWLVRRWYGFHKMQIRVARQLNFITCPSRSARQDVARAFGVQPEQMTPIALGVDQGAFRPRSEIARSTRRLITTASSDTPLKGLHILLRAFHQVLQTHPDLELVVIGKLRDGLAKRTLLELNLQDKVVFKYGLPRDQLASEFSTATIAVTPSLYEGFGLPAAEAMSCGTPVIVSDGGALPEVAGNAGLVVKRGDPDALAREISALLGDEQKRLRVAEDCLMRAQEKFNWANIAPDYVALFDQAIGAQC